MEVLRTIVQIAYIGICAVLIFIVLKQEGKSSGLSGALTGANLTGVRIKDVLLKV